MNGTYEKNEKKMARLRLGLLVTQKTETLLTR